MAKKEITVQFKLQAPGGTATPAPPIGPALGQHGVNPGQFIQQFNAATAALKGKVVGVLVTGASADVGAGTQSIVDPFDSERRKRVDATVIDATDATVVE